jgi:hypothetical protein
MTVANESIFVTCVKNGKSLLDFKKSWLSDPIETASDFLQRIRHTDSVLSSSNVGAALTGMHVEMMQRGMWAMSGFPTLRPTHRAAAAWMATSFENAAVSFKAPWPSFMIRVPDRLLWIQGVEDVRQVVLISAAQFKGAWWYSIVTENHPKEAAISVWAYSVPNEIMIGKQLPVRPVEWDVLEKTSLDERTELLARRLIMGMCAHFSDPARLLERKTCNFRVPGKSRDKRENELPSYNNWDIRSDISVDVVGAVREYARTGDGKSPKVQGLIAGHTKWQAHGPKHGLRKLIHVEPYWRGDINAPIAAHLNHA